MIEEEYNILRRFISQTPGWVLPSKENVFLQGMPIEKCIWYVVSMPEAR
jgi:hypothetical protein